MARVWMMVVMGLLVCGSPAIAADAGVGPDPAVSAAVDGYHIGAGDVLTISVWKNPDLTRTVQVLPDGGISFPLVGQLSVDDLTVPQLTKLLKEKLAPFQPDPQISVVVEKTNSLVVYVIGRVNHSDRFLLNDDINVLQALAMAGGLTPFAKRSDIKIFRKEKEGTKVYPFDYDAVTEGKDLTRNMLLQRGDVVVVP